MHPSSRHRRSGWVRVFVVAMLATLTEYASGCARPPVAEHALRIGEIEFSRGIHRLCVRPTVLGFALENPDVRLRSFDALLASSLQRAGYQFVAPERTVEVWERATKDQPSFDAHTGRRIEAKYEALKKQGLQKLREEGCDALLIPSIQWVWAPWSNRTARWDGVEEDIQGGFLLDGGVGAISFWVTIRDLDDHEIYFSAGGIQTTAKFKSGLLPRGSEVVGADALLGDAERNQKAVEIALNQLPPLASSSH